MESGDYGYGSVRSREVSKSFPVAADIKGKTEGSFSISKENILQKAFSQ